MSGYNIFRVSPFLKLIATQRGIGATLPSWYSSRAVETSEHKNTLLSKPLLSVSNRERNCLLVKQQLRNHLGMIVNMVTPARSEGGELGQPVCVCVCVCVYLCVTAGTLTRPEEIHL